MKIKAAITGQRQVIKSLKTFGEAGEKALKKNIAASAFIIQTNAKLKVPVDLGELKNSIVVSFSKGGLIADINATAKHAPYQEFGLGRLVSVPEGAEELALQFKGSGKRKINMKPQPYLWPSFLAEIPRLIERLKKEITRLANRT